MKKIFFSSAIGIILLSLVYLQCTSSKPADPRGNGYAGSAACAKCHSNLYNSYLHTAHYIASIPASANTIHGSFKKDLNIINVSASQKMVMEKHDSEFFQTYYKDGKSIESQRFDIVFGAVKGETYLYWKGNELYELPVSYYTKQNKWLMSPGYKLNTIRYDRAIGTRCMECHSSYIEDLPLDVNHPKLAEQYDKSTVVYSVDCERCHGPAADHVAFQTKNPEIKTAKFITSFASLPRARKLDMCGTCHSGKPANMLRSMFRFTPGDTLANYKLLDYADGRLDTSHVDVHGNQLQLLESSKCFINSKMDCTTCHDTHQNTRGNSAIYIQKCLSCHSTVNHNYCKMANNTNAQLIKANCIKCHMPAFSSNVIEAKSIDKNVSPDIFVHTHHIAIYPQEVKKVLGYINK